MKNAIKWLVIALVTLIPIQSFAIVRPFTSNCAALAMPKTVLLIHASWCSHCKDFLPVYEQVSNKEKYRDWMFYQLVNDKFATVCGTTVAGVPLTFKNNMKDMLMGNRPQSDLEKFLDSNV